MRKVNFISIFFYCPENSNSVKHTVQRVQGFDSLRLTKYREISIHIDVLNIDLLNLSFC